ncbi:DUF72 domain-containing protein [Thermomonas brevis]|uniref:DUF72 domain-containing protein n=1 Tax=Thermomonas brevis TaxID=215691 RepID=A0A7G9QX67_9GAMM|nr:DUF72 domain-containing protein [Thermomonas brevis]
MADRSPSTSGAPEPAEPAETGIRDEDARVPRTPAIRVGCAGWSIPARHRALFGEGDSVLARYATLFSAVEINSSFYRPHQTRTYARWADSVPAGFRFSVKMPRTISHERRLRDADAPLDRFLCEAGALGDRLGGFLLQLPPNLAFDARIAAAFFRSYRQRSEALLACEPRHSSWFTPPAETLLAEHGVSRVAADPPRAVVGAVPAGDARWRYWRWHGSPEVYYSDYQEARLQALAAGIAGIGAGRETWVIFDNTAQGHAIANANRLRELLAATGATAGRGDA